MSRLRLVVFDVDGTLVDSQGDIHAAMKMAFDTVGHPPPTREQVRMVVGLSLEVAFLRLSPLNETHLDALVAAYKSAYMALRDEKGSVSSSPLFAGARDTLDRLREDPWTLLAVATGKSKRGLDTLIEGHGLQGYFTSRQVADFHPSKPHPAMLRAVLDETGVAPEDAVMVGDTTFDMDMARAAGTRSVAVGWGYHPVNRLCADAVAGDFAGLPAAIDTALGCNKDKAPE